MDEPLLDDELRKLRDGFAERMPPQMTQMLQQAIDEIEAKAIGNALTVGMAAPDFTLARATDGTRVTLSERLREGPAVVSFYRGEW